MPQGTAAFGQIVIVRAGFGQAVPTANQNTISSRANPSTEQHRSAVRNRGLRDTAEGEDRHPGHGEPAQQLEEVKTALGERGCGAGGLPACPRRRQGRCRTLIRRYQDRAARSRTCMDHSDIERSLAAQRDGAARAARPRLLDAGAERCGEGASPRPGRRRAYLPRTGRTSRASRLIMIGVMFCIPFAQREPATDANGSVAGSYEAPSGVKCKRNEH